MVHGVRLGIAQITEIQNENDAERQALHMVHIGVT